MLLKWLTAVEIRGVRMTFQGARERERERDGRDLSSAPLACLLACLLACPGALAAIGNAVQSVQHHRIPRPSSIFTFPSIIPRPRHRHSHPRSSPAYGTYRPAYYPSKPRHLPTLPLPHPRLDLVRTTDDSSSRPNPPNSQTDARKQASRRAEPRLTA
ncbi:uncharacterized protein BKA78DRAFT_44782 [Phyllosticta capitalensis]|uniref:uncharacterized protein n=1 Tax=Phyllosticta capitalensis TaxID=121624 RepID=UPI003132917A